MEAGESVRFRVVVVGASAGGVTALQTFVAGLPSDLAIPILVVQHLDRRHRSLLVEILDRRTALSVLQAADGMMPLPGEIVVAPPDHHLLVNADGTVTLAHSELVHFVRPSADILFDSAARAFGAGVIAVVLTGTGADAAMGAEAVKDRGGIVLASDEATSEYFGMPGAAIATGCVDFVLPLDQIAGAITTLVREDLGQ